MNAKYNITIALSAVALTLIPKTEASLVVNIEAGSSSSTLNLTVNGVVDFVGETRPSNMYIYTPGVDWATGGLANYLSSVSVGSGNTAPTISSSTSYSLSGNADLQFAGTQDVINISAGTDFKIGDVVDYTFSVRNFNISSYNFTPLLEGGGLVAQAGISSIPEPATITLFGGLAGAGLFIRRRFMI